MKRILISLLTVGVVAGSAIAASNAFFSDTETSTGNTFTAGAIDLKVDNTSYVTNADGVLVSSPTTSWQLDELTGHLFFNFTDLKPGDIGEDTISLHVNNNNAWLCAAAKVTQDSDVTYSEPELEVDTTVNVGDPVGTDGELAENLEFAFWADDGDNVFETDEGEEAVFLNGPVSAIGTGGQITLADSADNVWTGVPNSPVAGGSDVYIGKAWCFGDLTPSPVSPGVGGPLTGDPVRGTGFNCNGASSINNAAQTDRVMGDLQFYAVQSRNNANFTCGQNYTPVWPTPT